MQVLLFNSVNFAIFFLAVYSLYVVLNRKWQNWLLLVASYVFYGSWDWRFLFLIWLSTAVDFLAGLKIADARRQSTRRAWVTFSVAVNLGILGFFKYFNFFADSLERAAAGIGWQVDPFTLSVVLPVGISFYTFQTMSYTIDVYRKDMQPTRSLPDFALFVAFFPQLVAGPIERARRLLPQFRRRRVITDAKVYEGVYLIGWGLFKKVIVADRLATIVDPVFASSGPYNGAMVVVALWAFAWQIYCDFSGYTDMARGLSRMMGFDLMVNFRLPYFATNPQDFWRRWHISLSTWLRDYLYIPLGGNRLGTVKTYRNVAITMLLGGLWHGAAWTFLLWGAYHGALLIVHRATGSWVARVPRLVKVLVFWQLVALGWLLFRAQSLAQVGHMLAGLVGNLVLNYAVVEAAAYFAMLVSVVLVVQLSQWRMGDLLYLLRPGLMRKTVVVAASFFVTLYVLLVVEGGDISRGQEFIYFQF